MADLKIIKDISIIHLLALNGYQPKSIKNSNYWYSSPFRQELRPSFKVCLRLNRWYDHGEGVGGSIIDLVMRLHKINFHDAIIALSNEEFKTYNVSQKKKSTKRSKITITKVLPPRHKALLNYANRRCISSNLISKELKEVHYQVAGRSYFGLGFQNILSNWEIRNQGFQGCIGKKAISVIRNDMNNLKIFEGFFDYLAFLELSTGPINSDILVLNSISLVNQSFKFLNKYDKIHLYLDNDESGKKTSKALINSCKNVCDKSHLYSQYIDINEFLIKGKNDEHKIFRSEYFK